MMTPVDTPPAAETVVVTTARLPTSPADAAFSIVTVDPAALQTLPRLDDVIATAPGASLFRRTSSAAANPTTQGLSLRSIGTSGAGRALVTLDGVPQNDPFGGWVIWSSLPPEEIAGVSLVRGAGAGPYGAGALTGVAALDEKSSVPGGLIGDVSAGSQGGRRAAAVASDTLGGVQLLGAASTETGDRWIPVIQGRGAGDTSLGLEDWSGSGKATMAVGPAAMTAAVGAYRETRDGGEAGVGSMARGYDGSLTLAEQPGPGSIGWRLQAWGRHSDLNSDSMSIAANRNSVTPADFEYSTPAVGWGLNGAVRREGVWGSLEAGADLRTTSGETHDLYSYSGNAFTKNRVAGGDTLVEGVYAEGAWLTGGWLLTGGARLDQWNETDGHRIETVIATGVRSLNLTMADRSGTLPTGRIGLRHDLPGEMYVRAAAYAGFRAPTLNELYRPYRVGNNVIEANENLTPEKLYGAELGVGKDKGVLTWSATGFVSRLQDAVTNVTLGYGPGTFPRAGFVAAGGIFQMRENAGRINAEGLEADSELRLAPAWSLRLSGAYTHAIVDGQSVDPQLTGKQPAETPPLTVTAGARWTATDRITLSADARYESSRYADDLNTLVLGDATRLDLRVDLKLTRNWAAFLAGDNVGAARIATDETVTGIKSYDAPRIVRIGVSFTG